MAKKKWSDLAESTKKRYTRAGITPQKYNSGNITPERKQEIYGKRKTSWQMEIAKQKGLSQGMRIFDELSFKQKAALADAYLKGVVARRKPFDSSGKLERLDTREIIQRNGQAIPNPRYGKPLRSIESVEYEQDFEDLLAEMDWESFEWNDDVREQLEASSSAMQSAGQ